MHVVFRESHGLGETDTPYDVGQTPGDLVVLSFSDSDLGAFAAGWHRADGKLPSTRLANLVALKHPLSVDVYAEQTLEGAKGVLVRLTVRKIRALMSCPPCRFPPCAAFRRCAMRAVLSLRRRRWRSWRWPLAFMPAR